MLDTGDKMSNDPLSLYYRVFIHDGLWRQYTVSPLTKVGEHYQWQWTIAQWVQGKTTQLVVFPHSYDSSTYICVASPPSCLESPFSLIHTSVIINISFFLPSLSKFDKNTNINSILEMLIIYFCWMKLPLHFTHFKVSPNLWSILVNNKNEF